MFPLFSCFHVSNNPFTRPHTQIINIQCGNIDSYYICRINAPRRLRLDNITAHTQEILAKIDQVNRRHGYLKPETPKRSHFVPGYFTADYNYKERVLKGFDIQETNQPAEEIEDVKKMEDYQAQMSVDHVKHIMMNYPYPEYRGYPPPYQSYNTPESFLGYDPYSGQYIQYIPEVLPFYALLPPEYLQSLNPPMIYYNPNWYNVAPSTRKEKCTAEDIKRSPKILEKLKALARDSNDSEMLKSASLLNEDPILTMEITSTTTSTLPPATKSHKVIIENQPMEIPTKEENRTIIKQLFEKHKENRHNAENRRNTKRPNIFRPHTWFNNHPMAKNKSEIVSTPGESSQDTSEDVSISESGESLAVLENNKGIFGNRPFNGQNRRKLFSKDNTGSGIFIHKLKVRRGGVAIAGPGGIATAGSGGTAIVGPNGYAFTHPDSLAIAGSGTKVIAVDQNVNLSDLVNNGTLKSSLANMSSRVGKVVATGPVIYYNKG